MQISIQPQTALGMMYIFLRMAGFFFVFPLFAKSYCPPPVSIFLALLCSLLLIPSVSVAHIPAADLSQLELVLLAVRELAVGLLMGFSSMMVLLIGQVAGQFLDYQMGFFTASEIDPVLGTRVPLMGNYLYMFSIVIFLSFNGHLHLLRAMQESFDIVPLGSEFSIAVIPSLLEFMSWLFSWAFQVSIPVLAALLVATVALGILARSMPQLNLFILGIPIRILLGMTMLLAMTTLYVPFFEDVTVSQIEEIFRMLRAW